MDSNNNFEQANSEINAIKDKMKELDIKQLNEINDIESFFGIKGLKEDNVETKAMIVLSIFSEFSYMKLYKYSIFLFISSKLNYKD